MKEVFDLHSARFGQLTKVIISQARLLGHEDDIFEGYRAYFDKASSGLKGNSAHKMLTKVTYNIYDALKIFEARVSFMRGHASHNKNPDGSGSFQFRSFSQLDQTVLALQHLFHELLKHLLDFNLYAADAVLTQIEEYLNDTYPALQRIVRQSRRFAA